jgi:hypothetical protein
MMSVLIDKNHDWLVTDQQQVISIGSKSWSLLRQSTLFCLLGASIGFLYWVYLMVLDQHFAAGGMVLLTLFAILLRRRDVIPRWADFIAKDAAYGAIHTDGITYRAPFRLHRVSWTRIYRLVYRLRQRGRIEMYLFDRQSPILFSPMPEHIDESQLIHLLEMRLTLARVPLEISEDARTFRY